MLNIQADDNNEMDKLPAKWNDLVDDNTNKNLSIHHFTVASEQLQACPDVLSLCR